MTEAGLTDGKRTKLKTKLKKKRLEDQGVLVLFRERFSHLAEESPLGMQGQWSGELCLELLGELETRVRAGGEEGISRCRLFLSGVGHDKRRKPRAIVLVGYKELRITEYVLLV